MKMMTLPPTSERALEPFGFDVPTISRLAGDFKAMQSALLNLMWANPNGAVAKMEAANHTHPDAAVLYSKRWRRWGER